jgi:phosphatidylserine decarboxylase
MAKPLPLPVWDRQQGKLVQEWMVDHQPHYESEPQRSLTQWIKSRPLYDRLYAPYENSRWSTRQIEPFIRKYHIDMAEFEPVRYRSFAEFLSSGRARGFRRLKKKWAPSPRRDI